MKHLTYKVGPDISNISQLSSFFKANGIVQPRNSRWNIFEAAMDFYQLTDDAGIVIREPMGFLMGSFVLWKARLERHEGRMVAMIIPSYEPIRYWMAVSLFLSVVCIGSAVFLSTSNIFALIILNAAILFIALFVILMIRLEYKRGLARIDKCFR